MDVVLSNSDRFVRNFVAVCRRRQAANGKSKTCTSPRIASAAGETPATVLPKLIRTYPDVIVVRDVADLETLSILCEQVGREATGDHQRPRQRGGRGAVAAA